MTLSIQNPTHRGYHVRNTVPRNGSSSGDPQFRLQRGAWADDGLFYRSMQAVRDSPLYNKDTGEKVKDAGVVPTGQDLIDSGNAGLYHASWNWDRRGFDQVKKHLKWIPAEEALKTGVEGFLQDVGPLDALRKRYEDTHLTTTVLSATKEGRHVMTALYTNELTMRDLRQLLGQQENGSDYRTKDKIEAAIVEIAERECTRYEVNDHVIKVGPGVERIGEIDPRLRTAMLKRGVRLREVYKRHNYVLIEATERVLAEHGFFNPLIREIVDTGYEYEGRDVKKKGEMPTEAQLRFLADAGILKGIDYEGFVLDGRQIAFLIKGHLGGYTASAASTGTKPTKRRDGYWTKEMTMKEARAYLKAQGAINADGRYASDAAELLRQRALRAAGRGDLDAAFINIGRDKVLEALGIFPIPVRKDSFSDLAELLETDENMQLFASMFYTEEHLTNIAYARLLAIKHPEHFTGNTGFLATPEAAQQLRKYKHGPPTLDDVFTIADVGEKDPLLRKIVLKMSRDASFGSLERQETKTGRKPTARNISYVYALIRKGEQEEIEPGFRWLRTELRREFEAFLDATTKYYAYINKAKNQNPDFKPNDPTFGQLYGAFSDVWRGRMLHADVAGYGKTTQEIVAEVMDEILNGRRPTIVFGPNSAKDVWEAEVRQNHPRGDVLVVNSYGPETLGNMRDRDFVVLNYESAGMPVTRKKIIPALRKIQNPRIVFDESQLIKGPQTNRYKALRPLIDRASSGTLVSFTPFDALRDAYVTISMLEPELYPTPEDARNAVESDPLVIHAVLSSHMTRRGIEDPPEIAKVLVQLSQQELEAYSRILNADFNDMGSIKLDQLMKSIINPALVKEQYVGTELWRALQEITPAKYLAIDSALNNMKTGEKAIIASPYLRRGIMEELQQRYAVLGALRIDSTVPSGYRNEANEREEARVRFLTDPHNRVMIINDTAGASLSLAYRDGRTHFFFVTRPTSLPEFWQFVTRARRRGNTNVLFYDLAADYPLHPLGSMDEGGIELIDKKLESNRIMLDGGELSEDGKHVLSGLPLYRQRPIAARLWTPEQIEARRRKAA